MQPLTENIQVDVAVVGGGFTGLSSALHLAQGGASVAVLEAVDIGFGGSGRNVGLVNAGMWVPPATLLNELGETYGTRLLDKLGNGPSLVFDVIQHHGIECQAVRNGTLHCAVGSAGVRDITERAKQWQALNAPVYLLDANETERKTGTTAFSGALLDLRAGTIQPLAYARGLASAAVSAGARVHINSPVVATKDNGTHWYLQCGNGSIITAKWVIAATESYTNGKGMWPQINAELVRLPYFNMATPPLNTELLSSILPERQGAWDTRQVMSSFRLDQAGRLVFGGVGALRGTGRAIHRDWGRRAMTKLFPQLKGLDFEHEWYGWIGMTPNALPRFHRLARNTIAFCGYNGRGIAPGTVFGREMARLVLGEISEEELLLPISPPVPAPFQATKEAFYEIGAQMAHVAGARF